MGYAESIPYTADPSTGFLVSAHDQNVISAFTAERKLAFLKLYRANGIRLRRACREMGLSESTVGHHLRVDPVFKRAFDDVQHDYLEELEAVSKNNALNPKSVIERIFQLKCHLPERYGQENRPISTHITLAVDGKTLDLLSRREVVLDAELVIPPAVELQSGYSDTSTDAPSIEAVDHQ